MLTHVPTLTILALVSSLVLAGCGQSGTPESQRATPSATVSQDESPQPDAGEVAHGETAEGEMADEPAKESEIKLATAESPIRASKESAVPTEVQPEPSANAGEPGKLPTQHTPAMAPLPLDNVDTADLTMPEVKLTEHHAAMCLVKVGDRFPEMKLVDLQGQEKSLAEMFGEKLTLVVFWNGTEPTARQQLADLARYHQPRFGEAGLAIVAINTGDDPQLAGELAKQAGATFPVLCDPDGSAFQQVATAKLPRSYLLDADGQILWFDLEYSATTRRDMVQAIRFSLAH